MNASKYLNANDVDRKGTVLTIRNVEEETVGSGKDARDKWVAYFDETEKGLVLNKVNRTTIAELHGDETDDWEGKQITIHQEKTEMDGKRIPCLRVKDEVPRQRKANGKATPAPVADDSEEDEEVPF
jgi:hypothetical protein